MRRSAGILLHRQHDGKLEVLLVHPGGPAWARRDDGAWSIPKGEHSPEEDSLSAARREFQEELGTPAPDGDAADLGEIRQRSGKVVHGWAIAGDLDPATLHSNTCEVEWPPRSGKVLEVPEVDRAEWFGVEAARGKINPAQMALIERLQQALEAPDPAT